jgi:O-antigen biosynthesis protein
MRVALLVHDLSPSGGVETIRTHARALNEAGHEVDLLTRADWSSEREPYDCAVATWWETCAGLYVVPARRRVAFLQSFEERFYGPDRPIDREGAGAVLDLPVDYVVVAQWMRDALAELRPDARCIVVRNGIDKSVFTPRERDGRSGPLRVLVEGQPTLWFKAVPEAMAAAAAMSRPHDTTLVSLDPSDTAGVTADRVVGGLDPAAMADLYGQSHVLLKLSRVEGLSMPALEALHTGLPCLVTPFGGHSDYMAHGVNGAVVGFDDLPGTAGWLDAVATDRGLLERLSAGALDTASTWPSVDEAGRAFVAALEELAEGPPSAADPAVGRLMRRMRATRATSIHQAAHADSELRETRAELAHAQSLVHEMSVRYQQCAQALERARGPVRRIARRLLGRARP